MDGGLEAARAAAAQAAERYTADVEAYANARRQVARGERSAMPPAPRFDAAQATAAYRLVLGRGDLPKPARATGLAELAALLRRAGEPRLAAGELDRAISESPAQGRPALQLARGDALRAAGQLALAADAYAIAIRLGTAEVADRARLERAWSLAALGRSEEAQATLAEAAGSRDSRTRSDAWDQLAWGMLERPTARALADLDGARAWHRPVLVALSRWHGELGRPESAGELRRGLYRRDVTASTALDDLEAAIGHFDRAGRFEASAELLADAARGLGGAPAADRLDGLLARRGLVLHRAARERHSPTLYRKAAAAYATYARLRPDSPATRRDAPYRAECLYHAGRFLQAAKLYAQVHGQTDDPALVEAMAYGAVRSLEAAVSEGVGAGRLPARADTRSEVATLTATRHPLPSLVQRWLHAVTVHRDAVRDEAGIQRAQVLGWRAALVLARHGYRVEAIDRLGELTTRSGAPQLLQRWRAQEP